MKSKLLDRFKTAVKEMWRDSAIASVTEEFMDLIGHLGNDVRWWLGEVDEENDIRGYAILCVYAVLWSVLAALLFGMMLVLQLVVLGIVCATMFAVVELAICFWKVSLVVLAILAVVFGIPMSIIALRKLYTAHRKD